MIVRRGEVTQTGRLHTQGSAGRGGIELQQASVSKWLVKGMHATAVLLCLATGMYNYYCCCCMAIPVCTGNYLVSITRTETGTLEAKCNEKADVFCVFLSLPLFSLFSRIQQWHGWELQQYNSQMQVLHCSINSTINTHFTATH